MRGQEQLISAMNWRLNIKMRWIPHCKSRQLCLALMFFFIFVIFLFFFFFSIQLKIHWSLTRNTSKFILSGIFVESLVILWMMMIKMMVMNLFPIEQSNVSNSPPKIIHFLSYDCLGSSSISVVRSKSILYMRMVSCFYLSRLTFNLMIKKSTVGFIIVKCKYK